MEVSVYSGCKILPTQGLWRAHRFFTQANNQLAKEHLIYFLNKRAVAEAHCIVTHDGLPTSPNVKIASWLMPIPRALCIPTTLNIKGKLLTFPVSPSSPFFLNFALMQIPSLMAFHSCCLEFFCWFTYSCLGPQLAFPIFSYSYSFASLCLSSLVNTLN